MAEIFIFTAADDNAKGNLNKSIDNSVPAELVYGNTTLEQMPKLELVEKNIGQFFAWGATPAVPGKTGQNKQYWDRMSPGDIVLCAYNNHWRYIAKVAGKIESAELASKIWGYKTVDTHGGKPSVQQTWQYIYFLTEPVKLSPPIEYTKLSQYLPSRPQGFTRVVSTMPALKSAFGSINDFYDKIKDGKIDVEPTISPIIADLLSQEIGGVQATKIEKLDNVASELDSEGSFDASNEDDARDKVLRSIAVRQGQPKFRRSLLLAYGEKCAITGFDSESALEAAHIKPYMGEHTNHVKNGLLLRSDIHTLFDRYLISINPNTLNVEINKSLVNTRYRYLKDKSLIQPSDNRSMPDNEALGWHYQEFMAAK